MATLATDAVTDTEGNPNIFFIIGAPTRLTVREFKTFCGDEDGKATKPNVKLAICADIDTHIKALAGENVFETPTNFRAHGDDKGHAFFTLEKGEEVEKSLNNLEEFKELQTDTAESIYDILKYAKEKKIHTYFASVPRELRPILLHKELGDKEKQIKMIDNHEELDDTKKEELKAKLEKIHENGGGDIYPHIISGKYILEKFDLDLTTQIYNKIREKGILDNLIKNINNIKISKHGATFLADVITVGCALLIGDTDPTVWKHYDIEFEEKKTKTKKYFGNSYFKFGDHINVDQENISYKEKVSGLFHGFDAKQALPKLTKEMKDTLKMGELDKIWGKCYVWHDAELNDVDDEPAITLIKQLSGDGFQERKSYKPGVSTAASTGGYKKSYGKKKKTKKTRRKTKNMRRKSKSKTTKKNTRKKKHYKKRKSKTHKKR
jgi:hypothetical protein